MWFAWLVQQVMDRGGRPVNVLVKTALGREFTPFSIEWKGQALVLCECEEDPEEPQVYIAAMKCSNGTDYYVTIKCGDRETTPFKFKEKWKAAYEVDHLKYVFGYRPDEPDLLSYDEKSHPNDT